MMLQGLVRRTNVLMLLSLLLGALCGTLVNRLKSRFSDQSSITMVQLQPTSAQRFVQPSMGWQRQQFMEREMAAMASPKEHEMESPPVTRRDVMGAAAVVGAAMTNG